MNKDDARHELIYQELSQIVGAEYVMADPDVLAGYSSDHSLTRPRRPRIAVFPANAEEIQRIIEYANNTKTPITPRSSAVGFYGAGIPDYGGILMDLRRHWATALCSTGGKTSIK